MSIFNLDRFRFEKKAPSKDQVCGSKSPESEKENKPGKLELASIPVSQMSQTCCRYLSQSYFVCLHVCVCFCG